MTTSSSSSIRAQHSALLDAADVAEGITGELFDMAHASLLVAEAFARQHLQLQQAKESDYLAYIVGYAKSPSGGGGGGGALSDQMPQLETVLSTGAGYLVEAGDADAGIAAERLLALRRALYAAAHHISHEDARTAAVVRAALQEQQAHFDRERGDLERRLAEAEEAVAVASRATAALIAPVSSAPAAVVAAAAPPLVAVEPDARSPESARPVSETAEGESPAASPVSVMQESHEDVHNAGASVEPSAAPSHSGSRQHHFNAAASLSSLPLVRADAWLSRSPNKNAATRFSTAPSSADPASNALVFGGAYRSKSALVLGSTSSATAGAGVGATTAVANAVRWGPSSPSSRSGSAYAIAAAAASTAAAEEKFMTAEEKEERRQRRERIIHVIQGERFEPKDVDWGRSVTADPYRSQDVDETWARPWRRYEEKQQERARREREEAEALRRQAQEQQEREQQQQEQEQEEEQQWRQRSPEWQRPEDEAFLQHQRDRFLHASDPQPQDRQVSPDSDAPHTAPNTARRDMWVPVKDDAPPPEGFVHPADLLKMRAANTATAATGAVMQDPNMSGELSAARGGGASTLGAAESCGALGSMRAGEAQAIVAVASGSGATNPYAIDTTLNWLLRTSHGPMLNLEQALLQRDYEEKSATPLRLFQQQQQQASDAAKQRDLQQSVAEDARRRAAEEEQAAIAASAAARSGSKLSTPPPPPRSPFTAKKMPGGKPPMATKAVPVAGKTATAAAAAAAKKAPGPKPAAKPSVPAAPPGRARGKSLINNNSSFGSDANANTANNDRGSSAFGEAASGAGTATTTSASAAAAAAAAAARLDAAALDRLHQTAGRADPVSEYQRQLQHGGAFVGIDEEQRRQQEERLQRSHAELSSHRIDSGGGGGGEYDEAGAAVDGGSGQIVEDEDEALQHLDRNSDYNPHQAASPAVDAASRRSHETDSLRQLHHLLGGVQASMLRDPGAPPLNPNEIDDSATRGRASRYNEQPAQAAAAGGGGRSSGTGFGDDGGAGVLHALHRALKQEARERAVKQ